MKKPSLTSLLLLSLCGCVVSRPVATETVVNTNGVVTTRKLQSTGFAIWPASQIIKNQQLRLGKIMSIGQAGFEQETGGTNVVEALKEINSIVGKIRP